ncbi:MAG TPA: hypothetical protein VM925_33205 [Labilithrix sp.]|jgi:hypothetical protein|nr:hypothetical protein [Labilithrix sp.]
MRYALPTSFDVALAEYTLGLIGSDELPYVGVCALREGIESPMLAALAGEPAGGVPADLRDLFHRGVREAGIVLPDERQAAFKVLDQVVRDVMTEAVRPEHALGRLREMFVVLTGYGWEKAATAGLSPALVELRACVWDCWYGEDEHFREAILTVRTACERAAGEHPYR